MNGRPRRPRRGPRPPVVTGVVQRVTPADRGAAVAAAPAPHRRRDRRTHRGDAADRALLALGHEDARPCDAYGARARVRHPSRGVGARSRRPPARPPTPRQACPAARRRPRPHPAPRAPSTLDRSRSSSRSRRRTRAPTASCRASFARIRDTKTKALALKARIESQDALFEATAIIKHPSWRRLRGAILDALRPFPDAARAVAETIGSEAA